MTVKLSEIPLITKAELDLVTNPLFAVQVGTAGNETWRRLLRQVFYEYLVTDGLLASGSGAPGSSDVLSGYQRFYRDTANNKLYMHSGVTGQSWQLIYSPDAANIDEALAGTDTAKFINSSVLQQLFRSTAELQSFTGYTVGTDADAAGRFYWDSTNETLHVEPKSGDDFSDHVKPGSHLVITDFTSIGNIPMDGYIKYVTPLGATGYSIKMESGYTAGTFTSGNTCSWAIEGDLVSWQSVVKNLAETVNAGSGLKIPTEDAVVRGLRDYAVSDYNNPGYLVLDDLMFCFGSQTLPAPSTTAAVSATVDVTYGQTFVDTPRCIATVHNSGDRWWDVRRLSTNMTGCQFRYRNYAGNDINTAMYLHWLAWGRV